MKKIELKNFFRNDNIKKIYNGVKKRPYLLTIILLFVFLIEAFLYICQINDVATRGYKVEQLERQLSSLKQDNYTYLVTEADLRSMKRIQKGVKALGLKEVYDKDYHEDYELSVAAVY